MTKAIAIIGAVLLLGSLVPQNPLYASEQSNEETGAAADVGGVEALQTSSDLDADELISNEEAVRREKICDKLWDNCKERCINWKLKGKKLDDCHDMCRTNYDECIADIK